MKGFTSLSEGMDPEEMDTLMSQVFGSFESIVRKYDGAVEKYIGDALVAVFGAPSLHEDDPARAINAALDFLTEIDRLNADRRNRSPIAFRIGINTGLITTGRRGEHDVVTGHAMAVASRLESQAKVNTVLVSQSTRDRCAGDFLFSDRVLVRARGKNEAVVAYEVRGRNPRPESDDAIFVGRKPLLDRMLRSFLRHDPKQTAGFFILGEAGIGKTRLMQELVGKLRRLPDFDDGILYARARRYGTRPFAVIVDLLSSYFQIDPSMSVDQVAGIVRDELAIEERTASGFASIVAGNAEEQDNQAFVVLYLVLKSIVKRTIDAPYSTLLCVDDLYFMDKSSRDFFQFYLRNADASPFFVFIDREGDDRFQQVFHDLDVIRLEPLDRDETLELVQSLATEALDAELINSISENARGNPLFIREYVRYASENRDAQALPSTIQNIFLSSIESYEASLRDLLKKLSVFAHSFSVQDARHIQRVTDGDPEMVEEAIGFFLREGIFIQDGELYMFRYDLFKKALYNSLLNYNKKILHRIIAELMQRKGKPHPIRLLHHLYRAGEYDRATDALMESPNATSQVEYLKYIDRLLEHVGEHDFDRYMRLLFVKSAILFNNGITEEADSLLKGMVETALQQRSPLYAGSAYHLLTAYNMKSYSFDKTRYCGAKTIAYYNQVESGGYNVQNVLDIMASSELLRNRPEEVAQILGTIEGLASRTDARFSPHLLAATRAEHHLLRGEYRPAINLLEEVVHEAPEESEPWYQMHLLLAFGYLHTCDWEAMKRVDGVILGGPSRHLSNISQTHARLGVAHHFLGDEKEADRRLQQAEFNASQIRNDFDMVDACRTLAACHLTRGDIAKAHDFAFRGLATGLRHTATYPVLTLIMTLVETSLAKGEPDAADFYLGEADHLVGSGVLLPNRDMILYHYHRSRTAEDESSAEHHRSAGASAFRHELEAIGDDRLAERFLGLRIFGRVHRELLVTT